MKSTTKRMLADSILSVILPGLSTGGFPLGELIRDESIYRIFIG